MSEKQRFFAEFEMNVSQNVLFSYIGALDGLEKWYAEEAKVIVGKMVDFIWDDEHHFAKFSVNRKNNSVSLEFLGDDQEEVKNPNVLKMIAQKNEMTNGIYLMVEEYTDLVDTDKEFQDLWDSLADDLKDVLGV